MNGNYGEAFFDACCPNKMVKKYILKSKYTIFYLYNNK